MKLNLSHLQVIYSLSVVLYSVIKCESVFKFEYLKLFKGEDTEEF